MSAGGAVVCFDMLNVAYRHNSFNDFTENCPIPIFASFLMGAWGKLFSKKFPPFHNQSKTKPSVST